jgi:hypothetical protein
MIALVARLLGVREATAKLLAVLLGAGCLIALYGALWARGEHFRAEAATAKATADRQAAAYRETYNRTFLQHFKAKLAEEARTRGIRENADHDLFDATLAARDRAADYAARHQCVRAQAAGADSGAADRGSLPGAAGAAAQPDGSAGSGVAELGVWISRDDFNRCTTAAVRLRNAHDWGAALKSPQGRFSGTGGASAR